MAKDPEDPCLLQSADVEYGADASCSGSTLQLFTPMDETSNGTFGPPPPPLMPSELLARARIAMRFRSGKAQVQSALEGCAWWSSPSSGLLPSDTDLYSQLVCFRGLLESGMTGAQEAPGIFERSRRILEAVHARAGEDAELAAASDGEWARAAHAALEHGCTEAAARLQAARRAAPGANRTARLLEALGALRGLERPFRRARAAARRAPPGAAAALPSGAEGARGRAGACLLAALREARALAAAAPPEAAEALRCAPAALQRLEALAVQEAEGLGADAAATFGLGLHWSEVAVAGQGQSWGSGWGSGWGWVQDQEGWHVPRHVARAEELLLQGERASVGPERSERAAVRALRLYQHAKFLALKHHDAAAEWRFQAAAKLAAAHRRQKLAAHSLARLSYFVMLRGRHRDSLALATAALTHASDPFAEYIQVTLRRSLGELRTEADLELFEQRLGAAAGRLPSPALEEQRAAAEAELRLWRAAASGGPEKCLALRDAARVLICLFCRARFR